MTPIFLIAPPRTGATLLMRMLDSTPGITMAGEADGFLAALRKLHDSRQEHLSRWENEEWPRHRLEPSAGGWKQSVRGILQGWVAPRPGSHSFGLRLSYLGREGWDDALHLWSWILDVWPDARFVFLTRDQGKIEVSMAVTPHLKWVPEYGKCMGCCGTNVHGFLKSMEDFHFLNPKRTALLDYEDLKDLGSANSKLSHLGIELAAGAWETELAVVSGDTRSLMIRPNGKAGTADFDPFHPNATFDQVTEHIKAGERPFVESIDPFAPETTFEALAATGATFAASATPEGIPEPDLPWMGISIMAHPSRRAQVEALTAMLPEAEVSEDDGIGLIGNCIRAWEMAHPATDYHLVIQDDAVLCGDFLNRARQFLGNLKEPAIVSFYHGKSKRRAPWIADIAKHLEAGQVEAPLRWGPAVCIPTAWIPDMLAYFREATRPDDDGRIGDWMETKKLQAIYPLPCLVDHLHLPSLVGNSNGRRPAIRFVGVDAPPLPSKRKRSEEAVLPDGYKPRPARPFRIQQPRHKRAIVYPWLSCAAVWEELRFSIRSVERHFEDKECPIYILGEAPPEWLRPGGRVRWIEIAGYQAKDSRRRKLNFAAGLFEARVTGLQIADEVLWMNDDFYLLKDCGWEDFREALACGSLAHRAHDMIDHRSSFLKGKARAAFDLIAAGKTRVIDFAVHAPMLFERLKAIDVLSRFDTGHRGGFANLYHNWNGTPWKRYRRYLAMKLPAPPEARTLNHNAKGPDPETKRHLEAMFPIALECEDPAFPPNTSEEAVPTSPPSALFVTATAGGDALANATLERFLAAGVDCLALRYGTGEVPEGVRVIDDRGGKFQLAGRYLTPEAVAPYDFVFLWDDDLDAEGFDPFQFLEIMRANKLEIAQPALTPDSFHSHDITLQVEGIGRRTNFVEIMAPVYSRRSWLKMLGLLIEDNFSGWGYDYAPRIGRKGIIDCLPVTHTRPVRSGKNGKARDEMARTLEIRKWQIIQPEKISSLRLPSTSMIPRGDTASVA